MKRNPTQGSMTKKKGKPSHKKGSRVQNTDVLGKGLVYKQVLIPCIMVMVVTFAFLFWWNIRNNNVESQVAYIQQYIRGGQINDWQGKLDCKGIEDIKWFRDDKMTEIDVGRIKMTWENDKFLKKSNLDLIKRIGFEVKYSKSAKDIKVFWMGQEVEKWVR